MSKGIEKISWSGKGKVDKNKSAPNVTLCVAGDNEVGFVVDKWLPGTTAEEKKKSISWILQDTNRKEINKVQKNAAEEFIINIPKALCGPYNFYLEASLFGGIDTKNKTGLNVYGYCTPKILTSKWSTTPDGSDARKQNFQYGHLVYLGLETEGLNGEQGLTIEVYKTVQGGKGTKDDKLIYTYTSVDVIDGEINLKIGNTSMWFAHAVKQVEEFYVRVRDSKGKYVSDGKDEIHALFLRIEKKQITKNVVQPENITPLKVGETAKNFLKYDACRYDKITGFYTKQAGRDRSEDDKKKDSEKTVVIYDSKKKVPQKELIMSVIAGNIEARREVKITLDVKTNQCRHKDTPKSHKGKVIDLSKIEEAVVIEERTKANQHRLNEGSADKNRDSIITIGNRNILRFSKEEEGHEDKDDDNDNDASHKSTRYSEKGLLGISRESKTTLYRDTLKKGHFATSDTEVILDIGYDYGNSITSLLRYIWPLNKNIIQHYPIFLHTCAMEDRKLDIQVYPDIKWIIQFAYDCDPEEFQEMRKNKYDKYKVRIEKLDAKTKPKGLDQKLDAIDTDIVNAKKGLAEAKIPQKKNQFNNLINKLEKKRKTQEGYKQKYKNKVKVADKAYSKERRNDLFNLKGNISAGLSDLVISLHAEYDRPGESVELSGSYKRYVNLVKQILEVKEMIQLVLDGKKKSTKKLDKKFKQIDEKAASEKLAAIGDALKGRPLFSADIIPPSFAILGSWYAENPKDINQDQVGIVGEIEIQAKPFIGAEISMDFLALAQKAHPIVRGIITVVDIGAVIGVMPKITLELEITGEIEISGKWRRNSASGTSNFNQKALATDSEDDSPLTISGVFNLILRGKIELTNKFETYIFGSVEVYGEASIEVKTGITLSGAIKADKKGVYIDPLLTFHGLTLELVLKAGYKVSNNKGGEYASNEYSKEMILVLMNEYEGSFLNSKNEKIQFYIN
jgi:hypothetical protein